MVGEGALSFRVAVEEDKREIPKHPHLAEQRAAVDKAWAALKVCREAWSVCSLLQQKKKKSKGKLYPQNNSVLVNKETLLKKLHSSLLAHLSQYLETC